MNQPNTYKIIVDHIIQRAINEIDILKEFMHMPPPIPGNPVVIRDVPGTIIHRRITNEVVLRFMNKNRYTTQVNIHAFDESIIITVMWLNDFMEPREFEYNLSDPNSIQSAVSVIKNILAAEFDVNYGYVNGP